MPGFSRLRRDEGGTEPEFLHPPLVLEGVEFKG